MKNAINYFYNLVLDDIHHTEGKYYFDYNGDRYVLCVYEGSNDILPDIYNLNVALLERGIYVHQIILNKDGQIVTMINGFLYILFRVFCRNGKISLSDIDVFSLFNLIYYKKTKDIPFKSLNRSNWVDLWSLKNDYLEYQVSQIGKRYPLISESFSYYIGLGETAIQLIDGIDLNKLPKIVAHRRLGVDYTFFDLYNPLDLIIDVRPRDSAEYFKKCFFSYDSKEDFIVRMLTFLDSSGYSYVEMVLFLARMFYPTYYFDLFEDIIVGKKEDEELMKIIELADDYEEVLRRIYFYCKDHFQMLSIEWLE